MATPQFYYFKFFIILYLFVYVCVWACVCRSLCVVRRQQIRGLYLRFRLGLGSGLGEQETLSAELSLKPLILIAF